MLNPLRSPLAAAALMLAWCVGLFGRGYWTPDEPREADIAWRMSWQADKAVPLLAGEAFCEKPPLTYWLAAVPIRLIGTQAWAARLPNLLYVWITVLSVGLLARRSAGRFAAVAAAAAVGTFLLCYQVAIWLATDAPLLAAVSVALLGAYQGFYAASRRERLCGYLLMHAALGLGFLSKSAAAWLVPALTLLSLAIWERRWRELIRWELHAGLLLQAAMILAWVWFVFVGPQGPDHLKVFFWNNLVGRFTHVDAPAQLQYAAAHRNSPGKYLIELPMYLFPWTLLVAAAARRVWRDRGASFDAHRPVRFALAASLPPLFLLSVAATARNIYLAPALPGVALLLGWWAKEALSAVQPTQDRWDRLALRGTAALLLLSTAVFTAALAITGADAWTTMTGRGAFLAVSALGLIAGTSFALRAWTSAGRRPRLALWSLLMAYCSLLVGPASQLYARVDAWQDLPATARAIGRDAAGKPLILLAPDETTRAMIDMNVSTHVGLIPGPIDAAAIGRLAAASAAAPQSLVVVQLPGRGKLSALWQAHGASEIDEALPWAEPAGLRIARSYSLPYGRRYALLERRP